MNENITREMVTAGKGIVALVSAAAWAYFRALLVPVVILLLVMVVDYVTGLADAWTKSELSSRVGIKGIVKKLCYLAAVMVAVMVDWVIQTAAARMGFDASNIYCVGLLVIIWLVLNECISILENISAVGVPIPDFLRVIVERLKSTTEEKGGKHTAQGSEDGDHGDG